MVIKIKKFIKTFFKTFLIFTLTILTIYFGANIFVVAYSGRYIISADEAASLKVDCALVLGAGVRNGWLSPMLEDRVITGVKLYDNGSTGRLLMSGDHGSSDYDEVTIMKRYAVADGVPADCIFMDHAGFSTYESMYRADAVFGVKSVIVVTQKYHLYRAVFLARMMGIEAYGVAVDLRNYQNDIYNNIRESLARVKDLIWAVIRPEPTYLGDSIPISGDGSQTDDTDEFIEAGGRLDE